MIKAIFAVDLQGGMGKNGSLPWPHDKEDMQWFRNATRDCIVIMGSNTWLDPVMPKPLPHRHCVVVTNQDIDLFPEAHDVIAGAVLQESIEVLKNQHPNKTIWIIGGAKLINSTKHMINEIHLTLFYDDYDCDVKIDYKDILNDFDMQYETYGRNKIFSVWTRK